MAKIHFTSDDRGKAIVDADGRRIGTVSGVNEETNTLYADPDPNIPDRIRRALEWDFAETSAAEEDVIDETVDGPAFGIDRETEHDLPSGEASPVDPESDAVVDEPADTSFAVPTALVDGVTEEEIRLESL